MKILKFKAKDGTRHFFSIPEQISWNELREKIANLETAVETNYLSDGITEIWLDFDYQGYTFSINNQLGEYWFFANDISCPESILIEIASFFTTIPSSTVSDLIH